MSPKAGVGGLWGHLGHFVTLGVQVTSLSLHFPLYKISLSLKVTVGVKGTGPGRLRPS